MSSSSDSEFDGFSQEFSVVDTVVDGSDISVSDVDTDDLSSDDAGDGSNDAGGTQEFSDTLQDVDILPFREPVGPAHSLPLDASELSYFLLLFTIGMITRLVLETNLYAEQCQTARGVRDSAWHATTIEEMRAYIGVNILMGFHQLPEIDHYWSSDDMLGVPGVMKIMAKHRFKKMTQYFHANDNSTTAARGDAGYDPLHKVRPLLSSASSSFARRYRPGKDLSIDEAMIAFKGRSFMKQYLPAKPIKWGFKVWTIAEAATGYVCGFQVYVGKRAAPSRNGLGYDVVMELSEMYQYQRRHLYFDNFFSSIKLLRDLEVRQTYACATVRSNRAGLPLVVKQPGRLARGSSVKRQSGNLVAAVWHDKRDVRIVSTNSDPVDGTVQRRNGREVVPVPCPMSIINYNAHMGGVDLADQQRSYYGVGRESKKFWTYLAWYIINTSIVNSFILMMKSLPRPLTHEQHNMTHLKYRMKIVSQLVGGFSSRKRAGRRGVEAPVIEPSHLAGHDLVKIAKKLVCRNCSQLGRKTPQGRGISSTWSCRTCKVALCKDGCLVEYHTRHSV